jgi:hypothetical protein
MEPMNTTPGRSARRIERVECALQKRAERMAERDGPCREYWPPEAVRSYVEVDRG